MPKTKWIKLWKITRATEDIKWWSWKEINGIRYYTFDQAISTAKEQWLTLPTYQDFIDSGFTEEWSENNKKLADKLWFTLDGWCNSYGNLFNRGDYGYLWSSSERDFYNARIFRFNESKGILNWNNRNFALAVRPVLKNSSSDDLSIWQFTDQELLDELGRRLLLPKK